MTNKINSAKCVGICLATLLILVEAEALYANQLYPTQPGFVEAADPFVNFAVIEESDLAEMRGGLSIAGMQLSFGAIAKTVIDNVILQTVFNVTEYGASIISQKLADASADKRTPTSEIPSIAFDPKDTLASNVTLPIVVRNGTPDSGVNITKPSSSQPPQAVSPHHSTNTPSSTVPILVGSDTGISVTDITPENVDLSGVANASGVVIKDSTGFTAALHRMTQDSIQSTLASTRSNQKIEHKVDIQIHIQGMKNVFDASLRSSILNRIQGPP